MSSVQKWEWSDILECTLHWNSIYLLWQCIYWHGNKLITCYSGVSEKHRSIVPDHNRYPHICVPRSRDENCTHNIGLWEITDFFSSVILGHFHTVFWKKKLYCLWDYLKERQRASWGLFHNTAPMVTNWVPDARSRSRRRYKDIQLPKMDQTLVHTQQTQNQCPWLTQESDLGLVMANSKLQSSSTLKSH